MSKHKHCDVIKAWADGAIVQIKVNENWYQSIQPLWLPNEEYRASIAEVEGRPVFEGDVLYGDIGGKFIAHRGLNFDPRFGELLSWNPPKPKTVTIELLREDAEYLASEVALPFDICARVVDSLREALK